MIRAVALALILLTGCTGYRATEVYTKPEVDAIAARVECRAMARNLVQIARCDAR